MRFRVKEDEFEEIRQEDKFEEMMDDDVGDDRDGNVGDDFEKLQYWLDTVVEKIRHCAVISELEEEVLTS